jgi:hypothetical protein
MTARKMAATMAAMTSPTPAQRAGEISGSPLVRFVLAGPLRRVLAAGFAEAIRRLVERNREAGASILSDCGTLAMNTIVGGVPERGSFELR